MNALDRCLVLAVGLAAFLPFLGQTRDLAAHELRHAEVAREMAERGDFLVPTLFGREYVDKPPVAHAAIALLYRLAGGPSLALARLPSAVAAVVAAVALYGIGRGLAGRETARLAAFGVLGVQGYQRMARVARPDMVFTLAIVGSCLAAMHAMRGAGRRAPWLALAGAIAAVATIAKGPLGVAFPVLFVALVPIARRDLRGAGIPGWAAFGLGFAAGAAAWLVPVYLRDHGQYLHRVLTQPDLAWHSDEVTYPVWWYLVTLPVGFLPLTLLAPAVVRDVRRDGWSVALVVSTAMLVLLSVIPKKRPHYVLPLLPFLSLAVAGAVTRAGGARVRRAAAALVAVAIAAGPLYFAAGPLLPGPREDRDLVVARAVLGVVGSGRPIVCFRDLAAAIAFEGRRTDVTEVYDAHEVVPAVRRTGAGGYLVVPEADREAILHVVGARLTLDEVTAVDVPARHGRPAGSRVYRVLSLAG